MKSILLISTGGTIASEQGPDGLIPAISGEKMVEMIPRLDGLCEIHCKEIMSLDSSNLQPHHWQEIAKVVEDEYDKYDGFVITHGTDTMAYTSAALSSMFINLAKPVVITGAQLPIEHPETDGKNNIFHAFRVANSNYPGVHLVFGDKVVSGKVAKKMHTKEFNAFYSVNEPYEATIQRNGISWNKAPKLPLEEFKVKTNLDERVTLLKLLPGTSPDIMEYMIDKGYKGIVIEAFGAGGVPNDENSYLPVVKKALEKGIVVVCSTQCVYDGVDLNEYPIGILAARLGAISAESMTTEYATTRLMWALGNSSTSEEAKKLFSTK